MCKIVLVLANKGTILYNLRYIQGQKCKKNNFSSHDNLVKLFFLFFVNFY